MVRAEIGREPGPPVRTLVSRANRPLTRYVLVGMLNTALDFGLFSVLAIVVNLAPVLANVVSTTITLCVSFLLNRSFVFRTQRSVKATLVPFVAVTLFSALVVQSVAILTILALGGSVAPAVPVDILALLAKLAAIGLGIVTNFLGYRWLFGHPLTTPSAQGRA